MAKKSARKATGKVGNTKSKRSGTASEADRAAGSGAARATGSKKTAKAAAAKPAAPVPEPAAAVSGEPLSAAALRKVKSGLTKADLTEFRRRLLEKRADLVGDVEALETDVRTRSGDHFSPEHMADAGSNSYEQEFTLGLVESERKLLGEIHEALIRIENCTYGVCIQTGQPIGKPRLDAKPWAEYCIEVAREKERLGQL